MSNHTTDLAAAKMMIKQYGARAISKADEHVEISAVNGNREAAAKWQRVSALIEFPALRAAG